MEGGREGERKGGGGVGQREEAEGQGEDGEK